MKALQPLQKAWPTRRNFLATAAACTATSLVPSPMHGADPPPSAPQAPYLTLVPYIEAGHDEFPGEKQAMEIRRLLHAAVASLQLPGADQATGFSPAARDYRQLATDLRSAAYNESDHNLSSGWKAWVQSLGSIRRIEFYILPDGIVQFEVASQANGSLHHRTGRWHQVWDGARLTSFAPIEEHIITAAEPYFRDVTATVFQNTTSFADQLARGIPYWRSRLDPATGIDIYGSNGVSVGDVDGDGRDEIYVCQPGGLPNRLYKFGPDNRLVDITAQWNVGLLDDTSCALFLDLRNSGRQDLVILRSGGPALYLNENGTFHLKENAFHFATHPAGGFTGMAAADFDRDGKLDLYLCCYVYFQSEAQFTYASPYYDAQNGPPNFLFRNRLNADGTGQFEDCTAVTGINQNNNRFSFAPAWCDFNGDGWPDLYVANDFGRKNLYVNKQGHFEDLAHQAGVEDIGPGMSASWFDSNGDGQPDLYVANMWSDAGQRIVHNPDFKPAHGPGATEAYRLHTRGNSLYRNRGDGTFNDVTQSENASFGRWAWSSGGHDLDNDGAAELFVTCGMLTNTSQTDLMGFFWRQVVAKSPDAAVASTAYQNGWNAINQFVREDFSWSGHEPNVLHVRRGARYFDASGISGLDFAQDSRAFAITDIDGDGMPDLLLKSRFGPQLRVLQNNCALGRQSIAFRLHGVKSNRDGVGARIRVDGQTKWLDAGSGFLSQHSKRLIFGLGTSGSAHQVQILWPSGETQTLSNLKAGHTYLIHESSDKLSATPFAAHRTFPSNAPAAENTLQLQDTWLAEPVPLPEPQSGPSLLVLCDDTVPALPRSSSVIVIQFKNEPPDRRHQYAILRRYLFDWRTSLETPLSFLLNAQGQAVRVYASVPSSQGYASDLAQLDQHAELALPFPGHYLVPPQRDYFKFGVAFLWAGYNVQALPYLLEKIKRSPGNPRVLDLVGQIYLAQDKFSTAETYFSQSVTLDSKSPESFYGLGVALARQNRLDAARLNFQQAIALRPAYPDAINDLGALYMQLGQVNDALAAFRYGIEVSPNEDILYMNLARTYVQLGQIDRAREVMGKLLDRKPDNQAARRGLQELSGR